MYRLYFPRVYLSTTTFTLRFLSDSGMCCEFVTVLSSGSSGKYNPALMGQYQNVVYNEMILGNHVWFMDASKNNELHPSIYKGIDDHWMVRLISWQYLK